MNQALSLINFEAGADQCCITFLLLAPLEKVRITLGPVIIPMTIAMSSN
jgi:hypothetical protein